MKKTLIILSVLSLTLLGCSNIESPNINENRSDTIRNNITVKPDFTKSKIPKEELIKGCFTGQDCIPSIDNPQFEKGSEAEWMRPDDRVFGINLNGIQRAYPQRIMNWHEIVNDYFDKQPISITFCPLCGSAVAFERKVNNIPTEFGVSGYLHNSDLVMYDRYEGNLWQQITGEAIIGDAYLRKEVLEQVPIVTTSWEEWLNEYPETEVLSIETGFNRNYEQYPYGTYEEDENLLFGNADDKRLHPKAVVYGIEINGKSKAYPLEKLQEQNTINDTFADTEIQISLNNDGSIDIIDTKTNESIIPIRLFWFAWASFYPDTELY